MCIAVVQVLGAYLMMKLLPKLYSGPADATLESDQGHGDLEDGNHAQTDDGFALVESSKADDVDEDEEKL